MIDRVLVGKASSIERCVARVRELYVGHEDEFETSIDRQDASVMNLLRGCEQAIDMANRVIRLRRLDIPNDAGEAFIVLHRAGLLDRQLAMSLKAMVGFRNIAVHQYQSLDLTKVRHHRTPVGRRAGFLQGHSAGRRRP